MTAQRLQRSAPRSAAALVALLALVAAALLASHASAVENVTYTVRCTKTGGLKCSTTGDASYGVEVASVYIERTYDSNGWDKVNIIASDAFLEANSTDEDMLTAYYAVGYGEGYTTHDRIRQNYNNTFEGDEGLQKMLDDNQKLIPWIDEHIQYLKNYPTTDAFGKEIHNMLNLIQGLSDGYNAHANSESDQIDFTHFFYLSFQEEMGDVVTSFTDDDTMKEMRLKYPSIFFDLHCSALIKPVADDLFFSHVTWSSFNSMLRQYKTYKIGNHLTTMSSYPGVVHSIDDWYMTYHRLAVMETTNGVSNSSLFKDFITTKSVSEFLRVMIANFLATSSPEWVQYFSRENSGTYNNQWMVFDMRKYTPSHSIPKNTFWVAEQLPGSEAPYGVTSADMSDYINEKGYWASYNLPHFESVYKVSGTEGMYEQYGDFFSYTKGPRGKIFARDHGNVADVQSMINMMRYNDYKNDKYSLITNCSGAGEDGNTCDPPYSAMMSIASRGDLNPEGEQEKYGPLYRYLSHREHCATDYKIAAWSGMRHGDTFTAYVINGPTTYGGLPVFKWSESTFMSSPHYGIPDEVNFPDVAFTTPGPDAEDDDDNVNMWIGIGVGAASAVVVIAAIVYVLVKSHQRRKMMEAESVNLVD